jgi:hypothetical protein
MLFWQLAHTHELAMPWKCIAQGDGAPVIHSARVAVGDKHLHLRHINVARHTSTDALWLVRNLFRTLRKACQLLTRRAIDE